jgi:hypothetical protein
MPKNELETRLKLDENLKRSETTDWLCAVERQPKKNKLRLKGIKKCLADNSTFLLIHYDS